MIFRNRPARRGAVLAASCALFVGGGAASATAAPATPAPVRAIATQTPQYGAPVASTRVLRNDVQSMARTLKRLGTTMQKASVSRQAFQRLLPSMRKDFASLAKLQRKMSGYVVSDPARERNRQMIVRALPPVVSSGNAFLNAVAKENKAAANAAQKKLITSLKVLVAAVKK